MGKNQGMSDWKGMNFPDGILFFSDGIGTRTILFDREVFGILGYPPEV